MSEHLYGGRTMDANETLRHIGRMNVLAISGGRWMRLSDDALMLPVRQGYKVVIVLDANDTYTVRRIFQRGAKIFLKGEVSGVYADEVGEVAYRASCYHDEFGGK